MLILLPNTFYSTDASSLCMPFSLSQLSLPQLASQFALQPITPLTLARMLADGRAALAELDPAEDIHATAAYRSQLVRVLTARVLRAAYDDALGRAR